MITDIGREKRTTKRVALYARVSTVNHGQDPEVQLRELREFCQRRRFEIAVEYVDKGISGSRERRPSLDKLMTAAGGWWMRSSFTDMTGLRVACDNSYLHWRSSAHSVSTSSACTKESIPQLPTVASYSEFSLRSQSLSGN